MAWLFQIACGLVFLHFWGVIHCDMKPKNILVYPAAEGEYARTGIAVSLKICDLGFGVKAADYGDIAHGFVSAAHVDQMVIIDDGDFDSIEGDCHGGRSLRPPRTRSSRTPSPSGITLSSFLFAALRAGRRPRSPNPRSPIGTTCGASS